MKWGDNDLDDAGLTEGGKEFWQIFKILIIGILSISIPLLILSLLSELI